MHACGCHRMLFSAKALMFGEDFASDPVSQALGFSLRWFSKGRLTVNLQLFSQVPPLPLCLSQPMY